MLKHHMGQRQGMCVVSRTWHKLTAEAHHLIVVLLMILFEIVFYDYSFTVGSGLDACLHAVWSCVETCLLEFQVSLLTLHQQVVWQESYRKSLCGCWQPAPILKKFEAPEAWAPFSPTAAPELCLTLHTKWRLCVTNWFQLAVAMVSTLEGAVRRRRGQEGWWVCHMTTQRNAWCHVTCLVER